MVQAKKIWKTNIIARRIFTKTELIQSTVGRMNKIRKKENIGKEVRAKKIRINTIARGIFLLHEGIYPGILQQINRYRYLPTYSFIHSHESFQIFPKTLNIDGTFILTMVMKNHSQNVTHGKIHIAGGNNNRYSSSI